MHLLKYTILAVSIFSTSFSSAQEIGGCRILGHLTIPQIIRSCKNVTEDKSKTDREVAFAASQIARLLQFDKVGIPEEVIGYYLLSAEKGDISAFAEIGDIYRKGYRGQKPDYKKAISYYDRDTSESVIKLKGLAELDLHGNGVEKSVDDAILRLRVGAFLYYDDAEVRSKLCEIYSTNEYQRTDLIKAHFWCSSAVDAETQPILKGLYERSKLSIEMQLSKSQIIESNRVYKECSKNKKFAVGKCAP